MLTNISVALVLALGAAAGCATDPNNEPGTGGGGGGGGGGDGGGDDVKPLDVSGKYQIQSQFDIASNMPGKVGAVVNTFIDMTDEPEDPTKWVVDQIIAKMPSGTLKNLLQGAEPFVVGYLNDRLLDIAPDFVSTAVQVGNDFGDMAKHFGVNETYDIVKSGNGYMAVDTAIGAHFKLDNLEQDVNFSDYQVADIVVNNVGVQMDTIGKLTIAEHKLPLSYGKVLRIGLDAVIIPAIDPTASNLGDLLAHKVDCQKVGQAIADAIGFGGASTFTSACNGGLQAGAQLVYSKINDIDGSALEFGLTGVAKGVDTNHDSKVDRIQTGAWSGTLSYAGTAAPLSTATFIGNRM